VSYLHLARVMQAAGDVDGADEMMQNARQIADKSDAIQLDDRLVEVSQARLWIQQGDLEAAIRWVRERGLGEGTGLGMPAIAEDKAPVSYDLREAETIVLARVRIAGGSPIGALEVLKPLKQAAELQGRTRRLIEILVLEALAISQMAAGEQAQAGDGSALDVLKRALSLAEPEGYVRIFLDEGEPLAGLLRQLTAQEFAERLYASQLLSAFEQENQRDLIKGTPHPGPASLSPQQPLIEPLSERELEVLRLIADGSRMGILRRLVISLSTVRATQPISLANSAPSSHSGSCRGQAGASGLRTERILV
jgi:LuxR family maltose regulon positive regulatory protein